MRACWHAGMLVFFLGLACIRMLVFSLGPCLHPQLPQLGAPVPNSQDQYLLRRAWRACVRVLVCVCVCVQSYAETPVFDADFFAQFEEFFAGVDEDDRQVIAVAIAITITITRMTAR